MNSLGKYSKYVYAVMRLIVGLLFACHGAQKMLGWFADPKHAAEPLDMLMTVGGTIELVGGLLIALGLLTRPAALLASGMMAVAYFMVHAQGGFFPIVNHGESAVIYCFVFLYIFFHGGDSCSLDAMFSKGNAPDSARR